MHDAEAELIAAYEAYADAIFRFCAFMLPDRERALEIMQETFTKAWEYRLKGEDIREMRPFLYKVARNLCHNEIRRKKPVASVEELAEDGYEFSDHTLPSPETEADLKLMQSAIEQLPEELRAVVVMRHIDGLPVTDIARILNETENAVSVRIHRAIKRLKQTIEPQTP